MKESEEAFLQRIDQMFDSCMLEFKASLHKTTCPNPITLDSIDSSSEDFDEDEVEFEETESESELEKHWDKSIFTDVMLSHEDNDVPEKDGYESRSALEEEGAPCHLSSEIGSFAILISESGTRKQTPNATRVKSETGDEHKVMSSAKLIQNDELEEKSYLEGEMSACDVRFEGSN